MKTILLSCCLFLFSTAVFAQTKEFKQLTTLFPPMPTDISDADIRALIKKDNRIPDDLLATLRVTDDNAPKSYVALGKITTKTNTVLLYADIAHEPVAKGAAILITVTKITMNTKTGEIAPGGLSHYLTMSGQDALKREAKITFRSPKMEFYMKSTSLDGSKTEEETQVYSLGKKDLDFVSRDVK